MDAMRSAEQELDAFWKAVDDNLRGKNLAGTAIWKLLSHKKTPHRTPEWVESDQSAKQDLKQTIAVPLSEFYLDLELKTQSTIGETTSEMKAPKQKTKGTPAAEFNVPEPILRPNVIPLVFRLDARSFKVFRTLFYTPQLNSTPGEISWTDFLHAMVATGFAPEKLYGSVWQFSPSRLDVERSIQFHEPHPVGKLSYRVARRIGRRLTRAYGWEGSMFQLR